MVCGRSLVRTRTGILPAHVEPCARRRLGRRRLGRARPPAASGRPAEPGRPGRARCPRRCPLGAAVALVGRVAVVSDRGRSRRARGLRHPRAPARLDPANAGVVALHPRPHLAAAVVGCRPDRAAGERPADISADADSRRRDRRRRDPAQRGLLASRRGRSGAGVADQRRLVDDVPKPAARPGGRRRAGHGRPCGGRPPADAVRGVGRGLRRLRLARPDPALPARVRPPRPSRSRPGGGDARGRAGARRLPPARPRAGDAGRSDGFRGHGHRHVRPRPPAVHPDDEHEPRAGAARIPAAGPRLGPDRPPGLGPGAIAGPGRLRPARPARPGGGAHRADRLGADARLHERRLDRRGRVAGPARARARGHASRRATTSGCAPSSPPR